MSTYKLLSCSVFLLVLGLGCVQAKGRADSVYSPLIGNKCSLETVEKITGASVSRCPGMAGFQLLVANDDERMSISIVDTNNKEHPLNYWDVVTPAMSSLDKVAEWRVVKKQKKIIPIALIVGINSLDQSNPEHPKKVSFIAVAKITEREVCVVTAIPASIKTASKKARREADKSVDKPCLSAP